MKYHFYKLNSVHASLVLRVSSDHTIFFDGTFFLASLSLAKIANILRATKMKIYFKHIAN